MIAQTLDRRMIKPELEQRVIELLANGHSNVEIRRLTGLSKTTVHRIKYHKRKPKPIKLTKEEAIVEAYHGGLALREARRPPRKIKTDNLVSSLHYNWRGILAQEAGLYVPPEDRSPPS